ncbi:MAG: rod shape-determining protein RodA [Deltaproteobacteria bacterium]|nr:rod shape-determining protein RodA [Deltaproteobacteria bacterium]
MLKFDRRLISHLDWLLLLLTLMLLGIGVMAVYSATYQSGHRLSPWATRQLSWAALGLIGMFAAFAIDYRRLENWAYVLYGLSLVLLVLVPVLGSSGGGARRWIGLGFFSVQPSELAKVTLLLVLARDFHRYAPPQGYSLRELIYPAILVAIPAGLVLAEPNLGTAMVLGLLFVSLVFAAGVRLRSFTLAALAGGGVLPLLWHHMKPYQKQRVLSFLNPDSDPLGAGYHMIQSKITVGSGMLWGKGFLQGTQNRLDFLPEKHTDFVFAVVAEEWGFIGTLVLLALYCALLMRLLVIAGKARDRFSALVAVGVAIIVFWQLLINIGMNLGMLPVVGVPLPLLSYGGSSLLTVLIALGLALNVSTRRLLF